MNFSDLRTPGTGQMIPAADKPCQASASSVDTPTQGFCVAQARPLTVDTPMRMPVKDPGPCATAKASTLQSRNSQFRSRSSAIGSSVRLCVRALICVLSAIRRPSCSRATDAAFAEDSKASISIIRFPPP